jgi:hypothetical protein
VIASCGSKRWFATSERLGGARRQWWLREGTYKGTVRRQPTAFAEKQMLAVMLAGINTNPHVLQPAAGFSLQN